MQVEIKNTAGEPILKIDLPKSPKDLPLMRYVSFMVEAGKIGLPGANVALTMAKAVSEFSGQPLEQVLSLHFGNEWQGNARSIDGIRALYGWCVSVLGKWQGVATEGGDCKITYKGEQYEMPEITAHAIAGMLLPDVDVNTAVEVMETVRRFDTQIQRCATVRECVAMLCELEDEKEREPYLKRLRAIVPQANNVEPTDIEAFRQLAEQHGDPNGNFQFTRYMQILAILLRKPGESLPIDESEKRKFIADRMLYFQEIDTATALNIDFFLLDTFKRSGRIVPVIGTLIHQAFDILVETKAQNAKRMQRR
jgi:hypothetical protein